MTTIPPPLAVVTRIAPGEDVKRYVERTGECSGIPAPLVTSRRLLRRPRPAQDGMTNGLLVAHNLLGHAIGSLEKLKTEHTLWSMYCCGLPEEKHTLQWERLLRQGFGPVRSTRAPVLFSVGEVTNHQCPECEQASLKALWGGFTYFHRRLAVPYASVCPIHKIGLRIINEQLRLYDQQCAGEPNAYQFEMAWILSLHMEHCLDGAPSTSKFNKVAAIATLKAAGWIDANGRIHVQVLVATFIKFFEGAFADARLALLCQSEEHITNALRSLLRTDRGVYPVWCVLFVWFAEQCQSNLLKTTSPSVPPLGTAPPTSLEVKMALDTHGTLKAAANALKVSRQTLTALCRCFGLDFSPRPKKVDANLRQEIHQALTVGMPAEEVVIRYGISLTTLYRELKAWPELLLPGKKKRLAHIEKARLKWMALQDGHPGVADTTLRKLEPAAWSVLYRNDRAWLAARRHTDIEKTPRKPKQYQSDLLNMLNSSLSDAAQLCADEDLAPGRKSDYSLRKIAGITESQYRVMTSKGLIADYRESRTEYIERRLAFAKRQGAGSTMPAWRLAKAAGLRKATIERHTKSTGK